MHIQVVIIGAGPAGLILAHLLQQAHVDAIVLEKHSREHVEARVRAGVLEPVTVDIMNKLDLSARMHREGLVHGGTNLVVDGAMIHIDIAGLTAGSAIMVYGQSEVMRDLAEAAHSRGLQTVYEAQDVTIEGLPDEPLIRWTKDGVTQYVRSDFVAGCDGFHGVSRASIPTPLLRLFERAYPFGWLGVLSDVRPCNEELIYANHERGFALASMRSPARSRYYIQCALDARIENWPDDRFWDEVSVRLGEAGAAVTRGPALEKSITPLRSFVCEPMRWGHLFLAGDAAHIVPPAGAKGLNLAVSDAIYLADALSRYYKTGCRAGIDLYSQRALARVWQAERFSWWFTRLTHRFPDMDAFDRKIQIAELDYIRTSRAAQTALAENYVGLPMSVN